MTIPVITNTSLHQVSTVEKNTFKLFSISSTDYCPRSMDNFLFYAHFKMAVFSRFHHKKVR